MDFLSLVQEKPEYSKQSVNCYEGQCPKCSSRWRMIIWVHKNVFKCMDCGFRGGLVQWLKVVEGLSCKDAHDQAGVTCDHTGCPAFEKCTGAPRKKNNLRAGVTTPPASMFHSQPSEPRTPEQQWQDRAVKLVAECHQRLLAQYDHTGAPLPDSSAAWLAGRGIPMAAVVKHQLGWLAGENGKNCIYRPRAAWGLPEKLKDEKPVKLWIPRGITIPTVMSGRIDRIRIRRPNTDLQPVDGKEPLKYLAIEGGGTNIITLNPRSAAQIAVESDLDAILIDHVAGDLVGSIPLTTCSCMPNGATADICRSAAIVLVSLDLDPAKVNKTTGREERAGEKAWRTKWQTTYSNAVRWPVPVGKDPGEAYQLGCDLRVWILAGLPVSLHPATAPAEKAPQAVAPPVVPSSPPPPAIITIQSQDGRIIHLTDDPEEYSRLAREKAIVFNSHEMAAIKAAGYSKEQNARLLDLKQQMVDIFGPADIAKIIKETP